MHRAIQFMSTGRRPSWLLCLCAVKRHSIMQGQYYAGTVAICIIYTVMINMQTYPMILCKQKPSSHACMHACIISRMGM